MIQFTVHVVRHWKEPGKMTIEAEDYVEAREKAYEMLSYDSDEIEWESMTPEQDEIESVQES